MPEASPRSPDAATPARILLVEDELNMARTLAKNLERAGYQVEHAPHGEAALARLGSVNFDVVLTDLKMPVMDGMELLRAMHERDIGAAAVVLTGYGTIETAVEAMKLGAADYLIKDARPQEILLTLDRVLRLELAASARTPDSAGRSGGCTASASSSATARAWRPSTA